MLASLTLVFSVSGMTNAFPSFSEQVGKSHSFIFHSACIWGLEIFPHSEPEIVPAQSGSSPPGSLAPKPVLPPGSFITCSSDDTIRIWNLSQVRVYLLLDEIDRPLHFQVFSTAYALSSPQNMATNTIYRRNIYSEDLLKTLYVDSDLSHIKEQLDTSVTNGESKDGAGKV